MHAIRLSSAFGLLSICAVAAQEATEAKADEGSAPRLRSIGPIAFGPGPILFVSDPKAAAIFAFECREPEADGVEPGDRIDGFDKKLASLLGTEQREIRVIDIATDPRTRQVYVAVERGRGPDATPVVLRVGRGGSIEVVELADAEFSKTTLDNAPADAAVQRGRRGNTQRLESITDLAYVDGKLVVAGLSNEEFASKLRTLPFPFGDTNPGASVEIYHGAHGRYETRSPVRTFVPFDVGGDMHILAAYTCTPLVVFPLSELVPGKKVMGRTVAELGNRNRPLDMIAYEQDGNRFLLMANNSRGVMKVPAEDVTETDVITAHVSGGKTAGIPYETIEHLQGVTQLDKLGDRHAVIVVTADDGTLGLRVIPLP